jgi:hypothetical protein
MVSAELSGEKAAQLLTLVFFFFLGLAKQSVGAFLNCSK